MAKEVVISNSTVNSYGFRVLTSGIDTTQYTRNPILLWMHNRPFRGTDDEVLPIGRIENLRIEDDNLIGTPVFDESDDFAMKIKAKWDSGFLKMVSAGLDIIEMSDDPSQLLPGQRSATVTKSKLCEVSIVDMGANDDAIVLYNNGNKIDLAKGIHEIDFLKLNTNKTIDNMKAIALKLGLPDTATEQDILSSICNLQNQASEGVKLRAKMQQEIEQSIAVAVDNAIKLRKITADKKDHFIEMGKKVGLASLNETLNLIPSAAKPMDLIHQKSDSTEYKKLSDVPSDKMVQLRETSPEEYKRLYKEEYGIDVTLE